MIYSVPQWILAVLVRYYAMGVLLGLDPNSFWAGLGTAAVIFVLLVLVRRGLLMDTSGVTLGENENPNLDLSGDIGLRQFPAPLRESHVNMVTVNSKDIGVNVDKYEFIDKDKDKDK